MTTTYTYPVAGSARPHAVATVEVDAPGSANDVVSEVDYDDAGNTTKSDPDDAPADTYTWTPDGYLAATITRSGPGGAAETSDYVYTADGARLIARDPAGTTVYLPAGMEVHRSTAGTVTARRYYTFAGMTVAQRDDNAASGVTTLIPDEHNTAIVALDPVTRAATHRYREPFGAPRGTDPAWPGRHDYLDAARDSDTTGWTHLGAREYDTTHGRFLSVDPLTDPAHPQTLNGYAYAGNNPVTNTDPSGLAYDEGSGTPSQPFTPEQRQQLAAHAYQFYSTNPPPPHEIWNDYTQGPVPAWALADEVYMDGVNGELPPGGIDVTGLTMWERIYYRVDARIIFDLQANAKADLKNVIKLVDDVFLGLGDVLTCSGAAECGIAILAAVPIAKPLKALKLFKHAADTGQDFTKTAKLADNLGDTGTAARSCLRSFAGDTVVLMADGTRKPIKDITVGDLVVATDPETGDRVTRAVTHVWVHDDELVNLAVDGQVITTTEDHLFWSDTDQKFERADHLTTGELVLGDDGLQLTVTGLKPASEHTAPAYNLSIVGVHAYHVGQDAILVHNDCTGFADLTSPKRRNHILNGDKTGGGHRSEFPTGWSDDRIMHEISDIATAPGVPWRPGKFTGQRIYMRGGIEVLTDARGDIISAWVR